MWNCSKNKCMVEKATEVSKELEELRLYKELDSSRHLEYPDDIMVYFLEEGKDVEACWVRLEGIQDGKMYGSVLRLCTRILV